MATPDKQAQLDALGSLIGEGGPGFGGEQSTVLCRVCDAVIDKDSGDPVEPVTERNVAAVREYLTQAGQAEEGGVALV